MSGVIADPETGAAAPRRAAGDGIPPRLPTGSLRRRVTLAALAVMTGLVVVLGVFVDLTLQRRLRDDARARAGEQLAQVHAPLDGPAARRLLRDLTTQGVGVRIELPDGSVLQTGPQPPATPGLDGGAGAGGVRQVGSSIVATRTLAGGARVTLVSDASYVDRAARQLRSLVVAGGAAVLAVGALVLWSVVGAALRPLDTMTSVARSIARGDRGRRLAPDRPDTELGQAAGAFDEMLDALEGAERAARAAELSSRTNEVAALASERAARASEQAARASEQAARAAEQRLREFLSDAAHELRTPVAGVRAAAESLLRGDVRGDERERFALVAAREAARAGRLVEDLLDMARIDRGVALSLGTVDLAEVAREQLDRLALLAPGLRLQLDGHAPAVHADRERVAQILANLLDNARRATAASGMVMLRLGIDPGDRAVLLDVVDDGPGVPTADRERIFGRLIRLDASRSASSGGAGLGLAIARGLARAHGGDLVCLPSTSGATFRLRLPVDGPSARVPRL